MVMYVESDVTTGMDQLMGVGGNTAGNWIDGTPYPILDQAFIGNMYQVSSYPTILRVCPDLSVTDIGRPTASQLKTLIDECPSSAQLALDIDFIADVRDGCESYTVEFENLTYPRDGEYLWEFGDGETSTEKNPMHTYSTEGSYDVKLTVTRNNESSEVVKDKYISLNVGNIKTENQVGPQTNNIGDGRMFEGGHQSVLFDVEKPTIISSMKVYSNKEFVRTIVLMDANYNQFKQKECINTRGRACY